MPVTCVARLIAAEITLFDAFSCNGNDAVKLGMLIVAGIDVVCPLLPRVSVVVTLSPIARVLDEELIEDAPVSITADGIARVIVPAPLVTVTWFAVPVIVAAVGVVVPLPIKS